MNVADNLLLQQMQSMTVLPKAAGNGSGKDQSGSFQDMMNKAGQETSVDAGSDPSTTGRSVRDEKTDSTKTDENTAPAQKKTGEKEEPQEELQVNVNAAAYVMYMFRPEIVEVQPEVEMVEAPVEIAAVEETVEIPVEAGEADIPVMEAEAAPVQQVEAPVEEAPVEAPETVEREAPEAVAETVERPVEKTERPVEAPKDTVVEEVEETTDTGEVKDVRPAEETAEDEEQPQGEAAELAAPVFHDVEAVPVKVADHYESVDTEAPDMDEKLADTILNAVENGAEKVQIQLTPANLGTVTIDLTRNADGALEVVIHAATGKAAGLLNQHLDGLHTALQVYGNNQPVHVEVQRGQESQEQHMFQQADPDGRGQQQRQQQEERQETESSGEDFLQKLRLGLTGLED